MKKSLVFVSTLLLTGCAESYPVSFTYTPEQTPVYAKGSKPPVHSPSTIPPDSAFRNPGDPERLLDKSSELVTMDLGSRGSLSKISKAVTQDPPTRAELSCSPKEALCADAKAIFAGHGIPAKFSGDGDNVTLVYERVVARDCDGRWVDNSKNPYNMHPPSFGCSVVGNAVQMVSDKKQFVDPNLTDFSDGEKSEQNYRRYQSPPKENTGGQSLLKTITTQ